MAAFSSGVNSMRNVRFDVTTEGGHFTGFAMTRDALLRPPDEGVQLGFSRAILLERVIIGMHGDRSQRDHLIAVEDANVFAFSGALQKRR